MRRGGGRGGGRYRCIIPGRIMDVIRSVAWILIARISSISFWVVSTKSVGISWDLPTLLTVHVCVYMYVEQEDEWRE